MKNIKKVTLHTLTYGAIQGCSSTSLLICVNDKIRDIRERNVTIRSEISTTNIRSLGFWDIREWMILWRLVLRSLRCTQIFGIKIINVTDGKQSVFTYYLHVHNQRKKELYWWRQGIWLQGSYEKWYAKWSNHWKSVSVEKSVDTGGSCEVKGCSKVFFKIPLCENDGFCLTTLFRSIIVLCGTDNILPNILHI